MKKGFYIGAFVMSACILTGCGSKVLECSRNNDYSEEMKMNQTIKTTFKKDKITKLSMDMDVKLNETFIEYRDELKASIEEEFSNLKDTKGIEYATKDTEDGFKFNLDADINKLDDNAKDQLDLVNTEQSYEDAKAEFESEGYTCK